MPCPTAGDIALDGAPDHPKKDGNGDGCVQTHPGACLIGEASYSRFDLNGDGWLSLNLAAGMPVDRLHRSTHEQLQPAHRLQALALALDPGELFDGWARDSLTDGTVLRSADVTLDLSQVPTGTTGIRVTAKSPAGTISTNVSISAQGVATPGLVTVPVAAGGSKVEVSYSATRNGTPGVEWHRRHRPAPLRPGHHGRAVRGEAAQRWPLGARRQPVGTDAGVGGHLHAGGRAGQAGRSCRVHGHPGRPLVGVRRRPRSATPSAIFDGSGTARTTITAGTSATGTFTGAGDNRAVLPARWCRWIG